MLGDGGSLDYSGENGIEGSGWNVHVWRGKPKGFADGFGYRMAGEVGGAKMKPIIAAKL